MIVLEYQEGMKSLIKECQVSQIYKFEDLEQLYECYKHAMKESESLPHSWCRDGFPTLEEEHAAEELFLEALDSKGSLIRVHPLGSLIVWENYTALVLRECWLINGHVRELLWFDESGGNRFQHFFDWGFGEPR